MYGLLQKEKEAFKITSFLHSPVINYGHIYKAIKPMINPTFKIHGIKPLDKHQNPVDMLWFKFNLWFEFFKPV